MKRIACSVTVLALLGLPSAGAAAPSSIPSPMPDFDAPVRTVLVDGDTAYLGGDFTSTGPATGPLVTFSASDATVRRMHTEIVGRAFPFSVEDEGNLVFALQADGAGGWYVGGAFNRVASRYRPSLVHLLPDGSLDPAFRADVLGTVKAFALHGDTLYIGGNFEFAAGERNRSLAAVDARTGAPRPFADGPDTGVTKLVVAGDRLFIGTPFPRPLDLATGTPLPFSPGYHGFARDFTVAGGVVYVGGSFTIDGRPDYRTGLVALDAADGHILPVDFDLRDDPVAVVADERAVFVGGGFGLAALDRSTGAKLPGFGGVPSFVRALALDGDRLYAAGNGPSVDAFDRHDGSRVAWTPPPLHGVVLVLGASGGEVAAGGGPQTVGGVERHGVAAVRISTGELLPFDAGLERGAAVYGLALSGTRLVLGGTFARHLAAVDSVTGSAADGVVPAERSNVTGLALSGSRLFVAGGDSVLGAVDLGSGRSLDWAPPVGCVPDALALSGGALYAGGCHGLRAFDAATLAELTTPDSGEWINALAADGAGGVWIGGSYAPFLRHLNAARTDDGSAPAVDGSVEQLAADAGTLYIGGTFSHVAGARREFLAAVDSNGLTRFRPAPSWIGFGMAPLPGGGLLAAAWGSATLDGGGVSKFLPAAAPAPPVMRARPRVIDGGDLLAADAGEWDGAVALSARWLRCDGSCTPVAESWLFRPRDNATYRVEITAANDGGETVALSGDGDEPAPEATPTADPSPPTGGDESPPADSSPPARAATPAPSRATAGTPTPASSRAISSARLIAVFGTSARVRVRSSVTGRVVVRVRLARGSRAIVGRATVAVRAGIARTVTVRVGARARHRRLAVELR